MKNWKAFLNKLLPSKWISKKKLSKENKEKNSKK